MAKPAYADASARIGAQPVRLRPLQRQLRRLVRLAAPELEERILWGHPTYVRAQEKVVYFAVAGDHVNLGFFRATELHDPAGRLEGTGKGTRHVKLRRAADLDAPYLGRLVRTAVGLPYRPTR